jgi:hypothetical protein
MTHLTPELSALVAAARFLPPVRVRQVTDYAEFLGRKYPGTLPAVPAPLPTTPTPGSSAADDDDDAVVDLGVMSAGKDRLDLSGVFSRDDRLDLSGVYSNTGMHSAIGLV